MAKDFIDRALEMILFVCPDIHMTVYSVTGQVVKNCPDPASRPLPVISGPPVLESGSLTARLSITNDYFLIFRIMENESLGTDMYCALIRHILQLAHQQEIMTRQLLRQRDEISMFLNRLFTCSNDDEVAYIMLSAVHQNFNLLLERLIILLDFQIAKDTSHSLNETMYSSLISVKNMPEISSQDLIGQINDHQIVICKTLTPSGTAPTCKRCLPFLSSLPVLLEKKCNATVNISIGNLVKDVREYGKGLVAAQRALRFSRIFPKTHQFCCMEDYLLEAEISDLPRKTLDHFFASYAPAIANSPWMFETIEALVQHNMDQKSAADSLYIHRNTLRFRLKQIYEKLDLNPYANDSNRFTLIAFYIYMVLYYPTTER